ncbi:MAG TPA: signal peptide peptidase SppA [Myxococcota bacterium]|nr:signal peptide peptidase SppA [Myxococcota bacterium]
MVKDLLRLVTRPLGFLLAQGLNAGAKARLGPAGVIDLRLDGNIKHPLLLLRNLEQAISAREVKGVVLQVSGIGWGWATLQEWHAGLLRVRGLGKLVVVFAPSPGNAGMYLATAADRIIVPPMGEVGVVGIGGRLRFIGPLLERLGLRFDVEAAGEYKSLGETFTREHPSAENREAISGLIDDLHEDLVGCLAKSRELDEGTVQALIDRAPLHPEEAKEAGLIDIVGYEDAVDRLLEELLGVDVRRVPYRGVEMLMRTARRVDDFLSPDPLVAVVHLEGGVSTASGPSARPRISPTEVVPMLRAVRDHDKVDAVVLHIQSPGGSVLASDLIWHEVELLAKKKPVIASFGDVAASGGYYIAAPVHSIVARSGTMTGSIGVVGGKLVTGKGSAALGVFTEAIDRGRNVGLYQPDRPFDDHQRAKFRERLEQTYEGFVRRVSEGRGRTYDEVEAVARGRVWTGRRAKEVGLVDDLGGLEEAIRRARSKAGIAPGRPWRRIDVVVRPARSWLMEMIPGAAQVVVGTLGLGSLLKTVESAGALMEFVDFLAAHPNEPLALMPVELDIR